jgi:hypothetical protein
MNVCMYACLCNTNGENMVRFKVHDDGVKGNNAILVRTMVSFVLVTRVLPSSQSLQPLPNIIGLQDYSCSNDIRRKVSFGCSIAYQLIQDYS